MADLTITINQDALEQARNTFSAMSQQVEQEIGRQQHLFRRFDDVMTLVREALAQTQHMASSEQLWHQVGVNEVASDSLDGRHTVEHMRSVAKTTSQQLIFAHPGPIGNALVSYTNAIDYAFGGVLSEYWNITDGFFPGNTIALSSYSSVIDGNFSQLGSWLNQLNQALEALVRLIDNLLKGESLFIAELTAGGGLTSTAQAGGFNAGIASATTNPGVTGEMVWSYLTSRYEVKVKGGLKQEGGRTTVGPEVEIDGDLWHEGKTQVVEVKGVELYRQSEVTRVGVVTGSVGLGTALNSKGAHAPQVGGSLEVTAIETTDTSVYGSKRFGLTDETTTKVGSVDLAVGSDGVHADVDAFSVEKELGINIAGHNVGVYGEGGLKEGWGLSFKHGIDVNLPFVSFGIEFGAAK
jgi:hypothetical protein